MLIIGIDPGLNITGYGIIETKDRNSKLITYGIIKTSSKELIQDRLNKIYSEISEILLKYKPEVLVLEKIYSHYRHPVTAIYLGYARGAVCLASSQAKIPIESYSAKRIKKAIVGRGDASKNQVQKMIQRLFNLKKAPEPFDVSDALALALGYTYLGKRIVIK